MIRQNGSTDKNSKGKIYTPDVEIIITFQLCKKIFFFNKEIKDKINDRLCCIFTKGVL